jgi:hypothetical protein
LKAKLIKSGQRELKKFKALRREELLLRELSQF